MTGHPGFATENRAIIQGLEPVTLLAAGPALALLEKWQSELAVLRHRSPGSDALVTLTNCVDELADAITAGRDTRLNLTITEANAVSRIPVSTLRWLCKHKPELIGARKHEGVWYIDRAMFERYQSLSDRSTRAKGGAEAA
jgi:hypothetical protein